MAEYTITYRLTEEQEKRLQAITAEYNRKGHSISKEALMESLLLLGRDALIERKLQYAEDNAAGIPEKTV